MNGNDDPTNSAALETNSGNSIVEAEDSPSLPLQKGSNPDIDIAIDMNIAMASVNLSQNDDEDGSRSGTSTPSPSTATEDCTFLIKDVTDYSQGSPVVEVELDSDSQTRGLLRGWSQEEEDGDSGRNVDAANSNVHANAYANNEDGGDDNFNKEKALKALKRGAVAVTGTALVVAGIPLIPMPTPGGVVISGSGLALLATEFPAAQRVLDKGRDGLERMVGEEGDDDDSDDSDDDGNTNNRKRLSPRARKGYAKITLQQDDSVDKEGPMDMDNGEDEHASLVSTRSLPANTGERVDDIIKATKKAGKRTKKNAKSFVRNTVLPLMAKITTDKEEAAASDSISPISTESAGQTPTKRRGILGRKASSRKNKGKNAFALSPSSVKSHSSGSFNNKKHEEPRQLRKKHGNDASSHNNNKTLTTFPVGIPNESGNIVKI